MRRITRTFMTVALPLLLLGCGQTPEPTPDASASAGLAPLALDSGRNNLYFEPILSATNGWGPVEINRSNGEQASGDGRALTVGGRTWDVGYGAHAPGELRFGLQPARAGVSCTHLDGFVGVDDEVGDRGSVVFHVLLGGVEVWTSGVMTGKDAAKYYRVPIAGRTDLRLVVTTADDGADHDHADWLQPTVHCEGASPPPGGTPGAVDPAFTPVTPDFEVTDSEVQPDGKIVLFGREPETTGVEGYVVARYHADGTPDAAFGQGGRFVQHTGTDNRPVDLTVSPDGRIVALGRSTFPRPPIPGQAEQDVYVVLRLLPDGTPDPTARLVDGRPGAFLTRDAPAVSSALTVQNDGSIVVVGATGLSGAFGTPPATLAVTRLLPGGAPDPTFGTAGQVKVVFGLSSDTVTDHTRGTVIRVRPDGRLLVGGVREEVRDSARREGWVFAALGPDGQLDPGFGEGGRVFGELRRFGGVSLRDLELLPDGRFVVADGAAFGVCQIARFTADGRLDPTFANRTLSADGVTYGDRDRRVSLALAGDGSVLVGGCFRSTGDPAALGENALVVLRFTPEGQFDPGFGQGGWTPLTDSRSVHVGPDGGIVAGLAPVSRLLP